MPGSKEDILQLLSASSDVLRAGKKQAQVLHNLPKLGSSLMWYTCKVRHAPNTQHP